MTWIGCAATKAPPELDAPDVPRVVNLNVEPGDRSLYLQWQVDRSEGQAFSGYNIYLLPGTSEVAGVPDAPAEDTRPIHPVPYPGDTDDDPTHVGFEAENLQNGIWYSCYVRPVATSGRLGAPSEVRHAVCRPGGRTTLQPIFSGDVDGFDFSAGRHVNTDAGDCDVAFFVKNSLLTLIAPSEIDPLLHETRFWDAGSHGAFDAIVEFETEGTGVTRLEPRVGHIYVYQTFDGRFGKFRIDAIERDSDTPTIHFEFMYQPIPGLTYLR